MSWKVQIDKNLREIMEVEYADIFLPESLFSSILWGKLSLLFLNSPFPILGCKLEGQDSPYCSSMYLYNVYHKNWYWRNMQISQVY